MSFKYQNRKRKIKLTMRQNGNSSTLLPSIKFNRIKTCGINFEALPDQVQRMKSEPETLLAPLIQAGCLVSSNT